MSRDWRRGQGQGEEEPGIKGRDAMRQQPHDCAGIEVWVAGGRVADRDAQRGQVAPG